MSHSFADSLRSFATAKAATPILLLSAISLWAFILAGPSDVLPNSNDLTLRAAPTVGDERGPLQLVYFYRPDCQYCTQTEPLVRRLVRENGDVVHARFVRITTDGSVEGPIAGLCASRTEGRPATELEACLADPALRADVEADLALAERYDVDAVPAVWVGQHLSVGAVPYDSLAALLQVAVADL